MAVWERVEGWKSECRVGACTAGECIHTMGLCNAKLELGILWPVCIVGGFLF